MRVLSPEDEYSRDSEIVRSDKQAKRDATVLVDRMVENGEWPSPELLQQIVYLGDAAVEPLLAIVRSKPRGWPAEAPLHHALGLLEVLRPPAAIPDLIEIIKNYGDETGEDAANAIAVHGEAVFETLLQLAGDPTLGDDERNHAIAAAKKATGTNTNLKTRLADLLRPLLADAIEQMRSEFRKAADEPDSDEIDVDGEPYDEAFDEHIDPDLADDLVEIATDDGDAQREPEVSGPLDSKLAEKPRTRDLIGEILFRISDLAGLADPLARDLIKTAFAEEMVETFFIDETVVDDLYRSGGRRPGYHRIGSNPIGIPIEAISTSRRSPSAMRPISSIA